jgi:creatinine amidohydrolase
MEKETRNMIDMRWPEVREAAQAGAIVLFPLGVLEEHGPQLCLGTDIYTAQTYCERVQGELEAQGVSAIIAPPFYWGICQSTRGFIGSFAIKMETAQALLVDILGSLRDFGFQEVYGINAHGDIEQNILLMNAFREASEKLGMKAVYCFKKEVMQLYGLTGTEAHICPVEPSSLKVSSSVEPDVHAGDIETAIIASQYPGRADLEAARGLPPVSLPPGKDMDWLLGGKTKELSPNGYVGNPARFAEVDVERHLADTAKRHGEAILRKRSS